MTSFFCLLFSLLLATFYQRRRPPGKERKQVMQIQSLFVYPIKSCGGVEMEELHLLPYGPKYDRTFVIVDDTGQFLSQRKHPKLCLIRTTVKGNVLLMNVPDADEFSFSLDRDEGIEREVVVWDDKCRGFDEGDAVAEALSTFLLKSCRLVRYAPQHPRLRHSSHFNVRLSISFADAYPLLVISQASLDDLNQRLSDSLPMDRFRPNIVVGGCCPFEEDAWDEIMTGIIRLKGANQCVRCATTLVDQTTGRLEKEPLRTLETFRRTPKGVVFGRNFVHLTEGILRRGDSICVV